MAELAVIYPYPYPVPKFVMPNTKLDPTNWEVRRIVRDPASHRDVMIKPKMMVASASGSSAKSPQDDQCLLST